MFNGVLVLLHDIFVYLIQDTEIMVNYRVFTLLFIFTFTLAANFPKTQRTRNDADRNQVNLWHKLILRPNVPTNNNKLRFFLIYFQCTDEYGFLRIALRSRDRDGGGKAFYSLFRVLNDMHSFKNKKYMFRHFNPLCYAIKRNSILFSAWQLDRGYEELLS